jgi:quinone-modifying oxidoreductase subunit QmoB
MKNIATYICTGCQIGESLDIEALCSVSKSEFGQSICKMHPGLCNKEGIERIQTDIKNESLEAVVIAACSPRMKTEEFSFSEEIVSERVNLREGVVWCQEANNEDTQMMAEDYLRMGITKTDKTLNPKPYIPEDLSSDILVVGGGITGISSAIEGAKAGYNIILIEKENELGGFARKFFKQIPHKAPFSELQEPIINGKIKELESLTNIKVLKSTTIDEITGEPGRFTVKLNTSANKEEHKVATIVLASGWQPYNAEKLSEYHYGEFSNIVTNVQFEKMVKEGKFEKPSDKKAPENILFVQCAGSRDENHLPYCSNVCCSVSLKHAKYITELNPDANIYILYKDIRTPGKLEFFYKEMQNHNQLFFTKGEIVKLAEEKDKSILAEVKDTLLEESINLKLDLIVLATGMTPSNSEDLNLNYRLGKGLPELKYNFSDSHFICFPYETRRTGIYSAGTVKSPGCMNASASDAHGAVLKAIQCLESIKRGESVHPRSGDKSYPQIYFERCTDCKRCTEECPFGMYDENEKGTPLPNPARCRRCGICLGACPERVINFEDYSIDIISSMIKAVEVPDEFEEKPRILAFICENDAYPAFDMAGYKQLKYSPYVRIIPVRCIGSINKVWVSDALSKGFDGIMLIGCKPGDDYQCHFITGSELTETRGENLQETFQTMMLETERLRTEFIEINEYDKIPTLINEYVDEIEMIGPNPFKDI